MGDDGVRSIKNVGARLRSLYFQGEFGMQPNDDMDIGLVTNVLEVVTMSEDRIVEKNGRLENGAYASARNGHFGCMYLLIRNCICHSCLVFPRVKVKCNI